jgi:hypothetical protein
VRDDRHLERLRAARHLLPDAAEAGEAQHLAADLLAEKLFLSQTPCFIEASAAGRRRASASICAMASSATLMLLAPGAFITTMPRALAASTSTLSTPVPARAIARRQAPRR